MKKRKSKALYRNQKNSSKDEACCVLCAGHAFTKLFDHHKSWVMGRCDACGLVQVVPMPTEQEIQGLYEEDMEHFEPYIDQESVHRVYFRGVMEKILKRMSYFTRENSSIPARSFERRSTIASFVPRDGSKTRRLSKLMLLDIGCATGILLSEAERVGVNAMGVDISRDAVGYCRKRGMNTYEGTVYSVKTLEKKRFDIVSAFQIIEHERDPLRMMRRVYKLLKKNGLVVLATPNQGGFWQKMMGKRWFGYAHPEHVVLFDFSSMRALLEAAGFQNIEIYSDTPRPFPLSFAIRRAGDYFPWMAWIAKPIATFIDRFHIINPINPWDDMIVFARKV